MSKNKRLQAVIAELRRLAQVTRHTVSCSVLPRRQDYVDEKGNVLIKREDWPQYKLKVWLACSAAIELMRAFFFVDCQCEQLPDCRWSGVIGFWLRVLQ